MPVNASYEFANAEKQFIEAKTDEERLLGLEEMMRTVPDHKGTNNIRANLRTRYVKLKEKIEKNRSRKKGAKAKFSIKKGEMQVTLVGLTNSGKSSLLHKLTNANPLIANYSFTTQIPEIGILHYENCQIQIIDLPAIGSENFETGIINTSDTALIIIEKVSDILEIEKVLTRFKGKKIIVLNKIDIFSENEKRRLTDQLKSKRYNFVLVSCKTGDGNGELKEKIFQSFDKIRIYTKSPHQKEADKEPVIMLPNSTVESIAKIIFRGNLSIIKKIRIWGPSSKFGGQEVGMKHQLRDKDIVEFSTR